MKKIVLVCMALAAGVVLAKDAEIMDIRPSAEAVKGAPMAVDWQAKNKAALDAAVAPATLKAIVSDAAKADALCAAVQPAYYTQPVKAFQLAAVTQFVMSPDACQCQAQRILWVNALIKAGKAAKDVSVKQFFMDQLRWCACDKCVGAVYEIAGSDANLKAFADMIAIELKCRP